MNYKTTIEAFNELLDTPDIADTLDMSPASIRNWRRRLNNGEIKQETMDAALLKAGWTVASEKLWTKTHARGKIKKGTGKKG
jgi:hypothetical protein